MSTTLANHHRRHDIRGAKLARESFLYTFQLPEHGLAGLLYTWVDAEDKAGYAAWAYGGNPDGSAIFEHGDGVAVGSDQNFDDWRVDSLTVHMGPGNETTASYTGKRIAMDFAFRPMHPAYLYSESPAGCPSYFADDRMEQSGHVTGTFTVDGRTYAVDTSGHHDHSWGTRDWAAVQQYKWVECQAGDSAAHVFELNAFGRRTLVGYVLRDGVLAHVTDADFDVDYDADWFQRQVRLRLHDDTGRTTTVNVTSFARFEFPVHAGATLVDTMATVEIEGRPGTGFCDWLWPPPYLAHLRTR
ncbi:MAG: DUF7064 domain-containing protein [Sporichthyaceae bacterium]